MKAFAILLLLLASSAAAQVFEDFDTLGSANLETLANWDRLTGTNAAASGIANQLQNATSDGNFTQTRYQRANSGLTDNHFVYIQLSDLPSSSAAWRGIGVACRMTAAEGVVFHYRRKDSNTYQGDMYVWHDGSSDFVQNSVDNALNVGDYFALGCDGDVYTPYDCGPSVPTGPGDCAVIAGASPLDCGVGLGNCTSNECCVASGNPGIGGYTGNVSGTSPVRVDNWGALDIGVAEPVFDVRLRRRGR